MSYATPDDLEESAQHYAVAVPSEEAKRVRLLDLATRDVQRALGARWDPTLLDPDQVAALRDATCVQALYRAGQGGEQTLALDDGIAALGGVSFSMRTPPRFSPEADELLAGLGLFARSGTVETDPLDA